MSNVARNTFFQTYGGLLIPKKLCNRLFVFFPFSLLFMFHLCSIGYAMQQAEGSIELQNPIRIVAQKRGDGLSATLHDEETPLLPFTAEKPTTWRQNWFVKNIIVEFPIVGGFFYNDVSIFNSIKRAGKSTFMLVGGSVGMMLNFIPTSEHEDMATMIAKGSFNMAVGMWIATSTYNTILSLGFIGCSSKRGKKSS